MPLASLPAVLLQSIMHSLHAKEILALARCCKWTLQCADSPFAWRDCSAGLDFAWEEGAAEFPPRPSRLARFIPLTIRSRHMTLQDSDLDRLLGLMQPPHGPRIVSLGWEQWRLSLERGLQLLSHPALQTVRDIGLRSDMRSAWLPLVASLPCLTELHLVDAPRFEVDVLNTLLNARALRRLMISDSVLHVPCLPVVMAMPQLRMLCVYAPGIDGSNFLAFCTAMSGLQELWLQSWSQARVRSISSTDLARGFSSLRCLRTLRFDNTFDEETLPPVLHLLPALRSLSLPSLRGDVMTSLAQLCFAAPNLQLQLASERDEENFELAKRTLSATRPCTAQE